MISISADDVTEIRIRQVDLDHCERAATEIQLIDKKGGMREITCFSVPKGTVIKIDPALGIDPAPATAPVS